MFRRGWQPPHPTVFARRRVYEKYGKFDTRFQIGADWDLLLRLLEVEGIQTRYVPETWVKMRMGGTSNRSLTNILRNNLECLRAFRKYGRWPSPLFPFQKAVHRLKQFRQRADC